MQEFVEVLRQGMQTVSGGHINVEGSDLKAQYIPRLELAGNILQPYAATPTDSGTITYDEKSVVLAGVNAMVEFNPMSFADTWQPFQQKGPLVFPELPPEVQLAMIEELLAEASDELELNIWRGDTAGSAPVNVFDGIFKKAAADAAVVDVSTPVTLTDANIIGELARLYAVIPAAVKFGPRPPKIFVSYADWQLYGDAYKALTYKGGDVVDVAPKAYNGLEIVPLPGVPKNKMLAAIGMADRRSDLHLIIPDAEANLTTVQVERKLNYSDLYFMKMTFRAGIVFRWSKQITAYNA
jgi:hypothetical protein